MNSGVWIALAYGAVAITLLAYTWALRRRLERANRAIPPSSGGSSAR